MGNQVSMDSEDGPGFGDAKADNIIRGHTCHCVCFVVLRLNCAHNRLRIFEALRVKFYATFSFSARYTMYRTCSFVRGGAINSFDPLK